MGVPSLDRNEPKADIPEEFDEDSPKTKHDDGAELWIMSDPSNGLYATVHHLLNRRGCLGIDLLKGPLDPVICLSNSFSVVEIELNPSPFRFMDYLG